MADRKAVSEILHASSGHFGGVCFEFPSWASAYKLNSNSSSGDPVLIGRRREGQIRKLTAPQTWRLLTTAIMGKSQSKLSPEQLADLKKNTYCKLYPSPQLTT